jgi:hypothetical protein
MQALSLNFIGDRKGRLEARPPVRQSLAGPALEISERIIGNDLAPVARDQSLEDSRIDRVLDEPDRSISKPALETTWVRRARAVKRRLRC